MSGMPPLFLVFLGVFLASVGAVLIDNEGTMHHDYYSSVKGSFLPRYPPNNTWLVLLSSTSVSPNEQLKVWSSFWISIDRIDWNAGYWSKIPNYTNVTRAVYFEPWLLWSNSCNNSAIRFDDGSCLSAMSSETSSSMLAGVMGVAWHLSKPTVQDSQM